jgi:hypothetical protein
MIHKRSQAAQNATSSIVNDLTAIRGIGPIIASRLRDRGIMTYAHLAKLTPDDISAIVMGFPAKRIAKEKWIKQAQKLASKTESVASSKSEAPRESRQHYATFMIELLLDVDNSVRRTRITNVQTKSEESWAGWAESRILRFIAKCANVEISLPELAFAPNFPVSHEPAQLPNLITSLVQTTEVLPQKYLADSKSKKFLCGVLQVSNVTVSTLDSNSPQYVVHANETLNVHVLLDLTNVETSPSIPLNCAVTIWAKQLGTGARQIIGEQQITFMPAAKIPCTVESKITSQGTFRLEAMATLISLSTSTSPRSTIRAWSEGGLLQVY